LSRRSAFSSPTPRVVVAHSPTPSMVRIAACSKGEGKNALAACDWWCSVKSTLPLKPISFATMSGMWSFCFNHRGIAFKKERIPSGA
jgi:hypothetical protein